jgi:hypothetical protein
MKKQCNITPQKVNNSVIMDSSDNKIDEASGKNLKIIIIRMMNRWNWRT